MFCQQIYNLQTNALQYNPALPPPTFSMSVDYPLVTKREQNSVQEFFKKNPAYRRHQLSRPMRIEKLIQI